MGDVINLNSKNCFLFSNDRLLVTNNVNDLIVVNTKNVTLVSKKGDSNDIALQNARAAIEKKMAEAGMTPPGVPPQDVKQPIGGGRQSGSGKAALHKNIRTGGMGAQS